MSDQGYIPRPAGQESIFDMGRLAQLKRQAQASGPEAARQTAPAATKTWLVTSSNPRAEHAAMHGETVPIDDLFSNGAKWPGDPVLGAEGVAHCNCDVEIIYG